MSNSIIAQLPLFDDRPLPLLVAEKWTFNLRYQIVDDICYFKLHDWLGGLVNNKYATQAIRDMRVSGFFNECVGSVYALQEKDTRNRTQTVEYVTDVVLYKVTQSIRITDDRKRFSPIQEITDYLAEAGAFVDLARREPQKVKAIVSQWEQIKERAKLINEGFSPDEADQWLSVQSAQKTTRQQITSEWSQRGAKGREFARLTNEVTEVATGQTATKLKREMQVSKSTRDYLSAAQNAAIQVVESLSIMLHKGRDSKGMEELTGDIQDTRPIIDAARPEIERAFSKKPRRLKNQDQPKLLKDDTHE